MTTATKSLPRRYRECNAAQKQMVAEALDLYRACSRGRITQEERAERLAQIDREFRGE